MTAERFAPVHYHDSHFLFNICAKKCSHNVTQQIGTADWTGILKMYVFLSCINLLLVPSNVHALPLAMQVLWD